MDNIIIQTKEIGNILNKIYLLNNPNISKISNYFDQIVEQIDIIKIIKDNKYFKVLFIIDKYEIIINEYITLLDKYQNLLEPINFNDIIIFYKKKIFKELLDNQSNKHNIKKIYNQLSQLNVNYIDEYINNISKYYKKKHNNSINKLEQLRTSPNNIIVIQKKIDKIVNNYINKNNYVNKNNQNNNIFNKRTDYIQVIEELHIKKTEIYKLLKLLFIQIINKKISKNINCLKTIIESLSKAYLYRNTKHDETIIKILTDLIKYDDYILPEQFEYLSGLSFQNKKIDDLLNILINK